MKRYLILFIVAIFCLPSESFAQQYGRLPYDYSEHIYPRESALAKIWADGKYGETKWGRNNPARIFTQEGAKSIHVTKITMDETTGLATAYWEDGAVYRGQVYLEEIRGIGTIVNPDGSQFSGEWKWNLPNGKGTFVDANGVAFTVNFIGGVPHGKGVIQDLDGLLYSARWVRGVLKEKSIKPLEKE